MNSSRARQSDLLRQARAVLDLNWTGGFTKPALRQYSHQGHCGRPSSICRPWVVFASTSTLKRARAKVLRASPGPQRC
jgi:hypothetical protein